MYERSFLPIMLVTLVSMVNCTFSGGQGIPGADAAGVDSVDATPDANLDRDSDGVENVSDNCPDIANPMQWNEDGDNYGNRCDVCPHIVDNDQADTDKDGVGDSCDPQPEAANSWLYFNGFDQPLARDEWIGENNFSVSGGSLHSAGNTKRYVIRNKIIDHGDDVVVVSAITFSNPSTESKNSNFYKYGGILVRGGTNDKHYSCWAVEDIQQGKSGYSFMQGIKKDMVNLLDSVDATFLNTTEHKISVTVHGDNYRCDFHPDEDVLISIPYPNANNQNETALGLISSYADFEAKYLLAISLQPASGNE